MKPDQGCPTDELLERFAQADLPAEQTEALAAHLDECQTCWKRAEFYKADGALDDRLRWANELRTSSPTDITVPLARLSALLPDYELLGEIGRGGMGIVYRGRHRKLDRKVALKVLPALLGVVRPKAMDRFRREAALAAGLKHNNIVAVYDFDEIDGTLFYAMELVQGPSLREVLQEVWDTGAIDVVIGGGDSCSLPAGASSYTGRTRVGTNPASDRAYFRRVAEWVRDIADALHYAHSRGVIHRDIKPANLMLNEDGRLMITDFGLARGGGNDTLTTSGSLMGTCRYMSPEQLDGTQAAVDHRVDVYALGATLYEMLAFRPLYVGRDDREIVNQVLHTEPVPPRRIIGQVPRELETICLKALDKDPDRRYATSKALAEDLQRWMLDRPILAQRRSLVARSLRVARRNKLRLAATATTLILTVVAALLYGGYQNWRREALEALSIAKAQEIELALLEVQKHLDEGRLPAGLEKIDALLARFPGEPRLHVGRARFLHQLDRTEEGIKHLEAFLATSPDAWEAHYMLSLLCGDAGLVSEADVHARVAERGMPPDSPSHYLLRAAREPDPRKALAVLNDLLTAHPTDVGGLLLRLRMRARLRQYAEALADADRALAMRPMWAICHGYRGVALVGVERNVDALEAFGRAIELGPDDPTWWVGRGVAACNLGRFAEALADANRALELDPRFAQALSCRGRARAGLGDFAGGMEDCTRAIALDPAGIEPHFARMRLYTLREDWDQVIADSTRLVRLAPDDPRGHGARAEALVRSSRPAEAVRDYTRALELDPNNVTYYHDRGTCYLRLAQYEEAIEDYSRSIQIDPEYAPGYIDRAQGHWNIGRKLDAVADLTRAIELSGNRDDAVQMRAEVYMKLGWFDKAAEDFSHVLAKGGDGGSPVLRLWRGMAYELSGAVDSALADYAQVGSESGAVGDYAAFWRYLLLRQTGRGEEAVAVLAARPAIDGWTLEILEFLRGDSTSESLITNAMSDDQRCEAYYYIGRRELVEGRIDLAMAALARSVSMDRPTILESQFAAALRMRYEKAERLEDDP